MLPELTVAIVAVTSDVDVPAWLLVLGPAGGVAFYAAVWRAYRNTDKSHHYERETAVEVSNLTGDDIKIGTNNGTRERHVRGRNSHTPRVRV